MAEVTEYRKTMAKIIAKVWSDESFKAKFLANPRGVLGEYGIALPEGLEVKVVEQTEKVMYLVLPFRAEGEEGGSWMCTDDAWDPPCIRCV